MNLVQIHSACVNLLLLKIHLKNKLLINQGTHLDVNDSFSNKSLEKKGKIMNEFIIFGLGIAVFFITWNVYHNFFSKAERVHESNFSFLIKKFFMSVFWLFLALGIVSIYFKKPDHSVPNEIKPNDLSGENSTPITSSLAPNETNPNDLSREKNSTPITSTSEMIVEKGDILEHKQLDEVIKVENDSIKQNLSDKKCDYDGDDPIVRKRLKCD
jgi:hypothetical protein